MVQMEYIEKKATIRQYQHFRSFDIEGTNYIMVLIVSVLVPF